MEHLERTAIGEPTPEAVRPDATEEAAVVGLDDAGADRAASDHADLLRDLPEPPETGDDVVDAATAELARAMPEPLEMQVQAYERAHRTLQDRLADVEN